MMSHARACNLAWIRGQSCVLPNEMPSGRMLARPMPISRKSFGRTARKCQCPNGKGQQVLLTFVGEHLNRASPERLKGGHVQHDEYD